MTLLEKFPIYLTNSLTGKKELFQPIVPGYVGLYVCGPTVYNFVHLGNCRTFLSFDTVVRYLRFIGYKVRYVRNITDVGHLENDADDGEDKIAKKARLEQLEPMEIVHQYANNFHDVLKAFNMVNPNIEPAASGHIIEQIEAVKKLLASGLAYEVNGSVYFDVKKYNQQHPYGILSGRNIDELQASGRELDNQDEKRERVDFALWKKASPAHIMRWTSPWGDGFPGWHLECSVMSEKYLGETFDIHGGGMDLKFPHHECEIAQGTGLNGHAPVRYWMHSNMLTVNGQKMSKSLGNSFLPAELFSGNHPLLTKGYSPMTVRFFMLQSHYSSTLDFSNEALQAAEKGYKKLADSLRVVKTLAPTFVTKEDAEITSKIQSLITACYQNISDDFNTAKTLAVLFELSALINQLKAGLLSLTAATFEEMKMTYVDFMEKVFGLSDEPTDTGDFVDKLIRVFIQLRIKARQEKNYALSDKIRDELKAIGVQLHDGKENIDYTIEV